MHAPVCGNCPDRLNDPVDDVLLLFAVAAVPVAPVGRRGWFERCANGVASVISRHEDVPDVLLRLPHDWNVVDSAKFVGLHDDVDIVAVDPRFRAAFGRRTSAIVAQDGGGRHALLMLINAPEATLMPQRLFVAPLSFGDCLCFLAGDHGVEAGLPSVRDCD